MSNIPEKLKYTNKHEWVRNDGNNIFCVGITDHAQEQLGDLVFVELPGLSANYEQDDECAVVESVKAASDVFCPISGEVIEINSALENTPELINQDPYADGWLFKIKATDPDEIEKLLDAKAYTELVAAESI
ncbi:glycine cleavage system protein H [Achromatium sp. WMS3]|nr:glycine cleavage system protein H [Achromatium sp. WMS3]